MLIGLFIGLSVGVVVAALVYWLLMQRVKRLLSALKNNQLHLQQLAGDYENQLQAATARMQADHEQHLTKNIEHYQDNHMRHTELMKLDFETRLEVIEAAYNRELETPIQTS
ncbi:hypothetical protein BH23CYA1_BH23CYA1_09860 [soil metagenome]